MMTNDSYEPALRAAEALSKLDEESLLQELGLRIEDSKNPGGAERAEHYQAEFEDASRLQDPTFLQEVGRRWLKKAEAELMKFLCDKKNADRESLTSGKTIPQVAASLVAAGLFALISSPPAWAIVAATLVAQKIAETGLDSWCEVYYERQ
jgi:hypothetical protein